MITERCLNCGVVIDDDGDLRYHADISSNNMTPCQEDLLYESMP
ncbi:MAG TPA: hypothetical protein VE573_03855 [Nitrososphaeraceae archaeon]|nr:hypothetical protein [Nitrososphaeraceae archaeon]